MVESQVSTVRATATVTTVIPVELRQRGVAVRGVVLPVVASLLAGLTDNQALYLTSTYATGEGRRGEALTSRQRSILRRLALGRRSSGRGMPEVEGLMIPTWRRLVGGVLLNTALGSFPVLIPEDDGVAPQAGTIRVVLV